MHYFSNKFPKTTKHWGLSTSGPLNLQYWWPEVTWYGQIVVFQSDYDEIELPTKSVMTSFQWRNHNYISKKCHNIFDVGPLPIKFLATPVVVWLVLSHLFRGMKPWRNSTETQKHRINICGLN